MKAGAPRFFGIWCDPEQGRDPDHLSARRVARELVQVRSGVGGPDLLRVINVIQGKILAVDGEIEPGHAFGVLRPKGLMNGRSTKAARGSWASSQLERREGWNA